MNTSQCLVCDLIKSRTEMIHKGMLMIKKNQLATPVRNLTALDWLRPKRAYSHGDCCHINLKRLTRCEHELELELARLKLRAEQFNYQQELSEAEQARKFSLA